MALSSIAMADTRNVVLIIADDEGLDFGAYGNPVCALRVSIGSLLAARCSPTHSRRSARAAPVFDTALLHFGIVYLATRSEAQYVLHCFQKKTRKTARRDLESWHGGDAQRYRTVGVTDEEASTAKTQRPRRAARYAAGSQRLP